ncbi:MAG: PHP domain-containing protein [Tenuifilaceae bacterium]
MKSFQADLHIHTVLSPCGDLSMSPIKIVERAAEIGLKVIAITDHNSTYHGPLVRDLAAPYGIMVVYGAEITTKEEVHCLCLFNTDSQRIEFQSFIDSNLPDIKNNKDIFGYQLVVDKNEEIVKEIEPLLISALNVSINQLEEKVHLLGGLFIPAHIDRKKYSLISQLGFVPEDLKYDALELSRNTKVEEIIKNTPNLKDARFIKSSDSHSISHLGTTNTFLRMKCLSWEELTMAIQGKEGRKVAFQ